MPATTGTSDAAPDRLTTERTARRRRLPRVLIGLIVPASLIGTWVVGSTTGAIAPHVLPSPGRVAESGWALFFGDRTTTLPGVVPYDGAGWTHVGASLRRCLVAFALASMTGLAVGMALGLSRRISLLLDPLLNGLRAVPLYAWLPIMLVWFGIGESAARALIFLGALWPILIATADGVGRVPREYLETARMLGTPRHQLWHRIYLPAALPQIVTGLRLGLTWAWMSVTVAELSGATTGVGAMMNAARETSLTEQIVVGMLIFALVGYVGDLVLRKAARPFTKWSET